MKEIPKTIGRKTIVIFVSIGLIVFNLICDIKSFRNDYIFDLQNDILTICNTEPDCRVYIEDKELNRIKSNDIRHRTIQKNIKKIKNVAEAKSFLKSHSRYGRRIYLVLAEKSNAVRNANEEINLDLKRVRCYRSSKQKTRFSVYQFNTISDSVLIADAKSKNNLIGNGDCEICLTHEETLNSVKPWIEQGNLFYLQEEITLPKCSILVPIVSPYKANLSPEAFCEKKTPLDGTCSLHARFRQNCILSLYLFNHIPSIEGTFSFLAKQLNNNGEFKIFFHAYDKNKAGTIIPDNSEYYFSLKENVTYCVNIRIEKEMIIGDKMIFMLGGENVDLILDNLAFVPRNSFKEN